MRTGRARQGGYTYLLLLFAVAVSGYTLALLGETWHARSRHERQAELAFVLNAYQHALASYRLATPDGMPYRPKRLEELLEDKRSGPLHRHLRRLYADPLSGKQDWILKTDPLGITAVCTPQTGGKCTQTE